MSKIEHTPGPWQALSPAQWDGPDGKWVVPGVAHCGNGELSEGNARLIAAAPDLLAALQSILKANDEFIAQMPPEFDGDPLTDACDEARAAITKATGQPQA